MIVLVVRERTGLEEREREREQSEVSSLEPGDGPQRV